MQNILLFVISFLLIVTAFMFITPYKYFLIFYFYIDKSSFDCRLVQFVTVVLKEMDDKNSEAKNWAFKEALKHSQISGTFRNALSRRLDRILLPILAKIIALIDKNFNLTIIHEHRDSKKILSPIAKLWLEIFSEQTLCKLSYEDIFTDNNVIQTKKWVPGIGASLSDHFYKCGFPFSWICREVINVQKRNSAVLAGMQSNHSCVYLS